MSNLPSKMEANEESEKIWIEIPSIGYKWFEWDITERWNNEIIKLIEVIDPILVTSNKEILL